jgi:predicted P-loop ATPase
VSIAPAALAYVRGGLSVIPIKLDGSKAPALPGPWAPFQKKRATEKEVSELFRLECGVGIIGGAVSGGLEIIDFDAAKTFAPWSELVEQLQPGLVARLTAIATPNGFHVYFRSPVCGHNQKLAMGAEKSKGKKSSVLIETRGEGGYVLAPPSPASVHASGVPYRHHSGPALPGVPTITAEERELLITCARSFNEVAESGEPAEDAGHSTAPQGSGRPGDEYAARTSWDEILLAHRWVKVRQFGAVTHWRRPGKDDKGISATTGFTGDKLYVFSSNAQPFTSQRAYGKFSAFAWLNHNGDFSAAARALREMGFGPQRQPEARPAKSWDALPAAATPSAKQKEPSPAPATMITAAELERLLDDDIGAAMKPENFGQLMAARADEAEWFRIGEILRRKKIKRSVEEAAKKYDREQTRSGPKGESWRGQLLYRENREGELVLENCLTNYVTVLTHDKAWAGVLAFDEFANQIATQRPPPFKRKAGRWEESDALETKAWIEANYPLRPTTATLFEAIVIVAKRTSFNALKRYLESLEDQQRSTLDTWLVDFFGAPDTPYVRTVGAKWMISAVARAYDPGCKVDTVLILEGKQGLKKSRVLEQLCPDLSWFADGLSDFGSKAQAEEVEGKWIIELGELKGFGRELEQIKAFVTRRAENYRPAYARYSIHSPRKCVFAGTVNPSAAGYLRDETGNRRFWPIECTKQAPELTPALRDQLWAEAVTRYKAGEAWWLDDEIAAEATKEQAQRVYVDPWHEKIENDLVGEYDTSVDDILGGTLKLEVGKWGVAESMRVGRVLVALGWVKYRRNLPNGRRTWRYRHPEREPPMQLPLAG